MSESSNLEVAVQGYGRSLITDEKLKLIAEKQQSKTSDLVKRLLISVLEATEAGRSIKLTEFMQPKSEPAALLFLSKDLEARLHRAAGRFGIKPAAFLAAAIPLALEMDLESAPALLPPKTTEEGLPMAGQKPFHATTSDLARSEFNILGAIDERFMRQRNPSKLQILWPAPAPPVVVLYRLLTNPIETLLHPRHRDLLLKLPAVLHVEPRQLFVGALMDRYVRYQKERDADNLAIDQTQGDAEVDLSQIVEPLVKQYVARHLPNIKVSPTALGESFFLSELIDRRETLLSIAQHKATNSGNTPSRISTALVDEEPLQLKQNVETAADPVTHTTDDTANVKKNWNEPVQTFAFMSLAAPDLLAGLNRVGIKTGTDLLHALTRDGKMTDSFARRMLKQLDAGLITKPGIGTLFQYTSGAKSIASIVGTEPEEVFPLYKDALPESAEPSLVAPLKRRVAYTASIKIQDMPFATTTLPLVGQALIEKGIATKADLIKFILENLNVSDARARQITDLLDAGDVFDKRPGQSDPFKKIFRDLAHIAGFEAEAVLNRQTKIPEANLPTREAVSVPLVSKPQKFVPGQQFSRSVLLTEYPIFQGEMAEVLSQVPQGRDLTRAHIVSRIISTGKGKTFAYRMVEYVLDHKILEEQDGLLTFTTAAKAFAQAVEISPEILFKHILNQRSALPADQSARGAVPPATNPDLLSSELRADATYNVDAGQKAETPADGATFNAKTSPANSDVAEQIDVANLDPVVSTHGLLEQTEAASGTAETLKPVINPALMSPEFLADQASEADASDMAEPFGDVPSLNAEVSRANSDVGEGANIAGLVSASTNGLLEPSPAAPASIEEPAPPANTAFSGSLRSHRETIDQKPATDASDPPNEDEERTVAFSNAILQKIADAFPNFGYRLIEKNILTVDALLLAIPPAYLANRSSFKEQLIDLGESRQQYDVGKCKLKPLPHTLQIALGRYDGKALFEDSQTSSQLAQFRQSHQAFSQLMRAYSRQLLGPYDSGSGALHTGQFRRELEQGGKGRPKFLPKDAERFASLYTGETLPIIGNDLTGDAATMMDTLDIPSEAVTHAVPELRDNLLYSDVIREVFPRLSFHLKQNSLLTASAIKKRLGDRLSPETQASLVADLNSPDPAMVESSPGIALIAELASVSAEELTVRKRVSAQNESEPSRKAKKHGNGQHHRNNHAL